MIGFCSSAVLLLAEQAAAAEPAAHLINADLTGHAAAADSQLPAANEKPSAVSPHHIKEILEYLM